MKVSIHSHGYLLEIGKLKDKSLKPPLFIIEEIRYTNNKVEDKV